MLSFLVPEYSHFKYRVCQNLKETSGAKGLKKVLEIFSFGWRRRTSHLSHMLFVAHRIHDSLTEDISFRIFFTSSSVRYLSEIMWYAPQVKIIWIQIGESGIHLPWSLFCHQRHSIKAWICLLCDLLYSFACNQTSYQKWCHGVTYLTAFLRSH